MATRLEIRTRARIRADQTDSTFPSDTELNYFIDEGCKEVWYDLVKSGWPISFTAATTAAAASFLTLSGAYAVAVPVAFIRGVYCYSGGTYYELRRINEGERADLYSTTGVTMPTHYEVRIDPTAGIGVEILPYVAGAQIRVEYVREHPGLAADGTSWYGPARSDELVVLKTAAKACRKEGNDQGAAMLDREYAYLMQCVQDLASWVDMRNPATIRMVDPITVLGGSTRMPGDYDI